MTEWEAVDEVNRETAEILAKAGTDIVWKPDGDGAYRIEPRDE